MIEQCIRERSPFPEFIKNAPELLPGLELYFNAYWDLNGDRGGMGGPISWMAIKSYCDYHELLPSQCEALSYHLRAMDETVQNVKDSKKTNGKG